LVVLVVFLIAMSLESILFWNIRGLNAQSHRSTLRDLVAAERPSIVCIQETKLHVISDYDIAQFLGVSFDYYMPADQTHGGILVAWKVVVWTVLVPSLWQHSVTIKIASVASNEDWWLSCVYMPSRDEDKDDFLQELRTLAQSHQGPWLVGGDFNLIYQEDD
jgi:exonuclease III